MIVKPNIEKEMNEFQDKAADACDLHLMDLHANHYPRTGELKITPSFHTKRFTDKRSLGLGGSPAGTCAEGTSGH